MFYGDGTLTGGQPVTLALDNAPANAPVALALAWARNDVPLFGATLVPDVVQAGFTVGVAADANGSFSLGFNWPNGLPSGHSYYMQCWLADASAPFGIAASNAVVATAP